MKRVSVVGTYHVEHGAANPSALLAILERINPEVIFLEMPAEALDDHFNGTRSNLESTAVGLYLGNHTVALVPVDLPTPDASFFREHAEMGDRIYRTNQDTRRLIDWNGKYVHAHGFAYLNSEHSDKLWAEFREADLAALKTLGDEKLTDCYELWCKTLESRDQAMIHNIKAYCQQDVFSRGAFLVGAAHRKRLMELTQPRPGGDPTDLEWDFAGFLEEPI